MVLPITSAVGISTKPAEAFSGCAARRMPQSERKELAFQVLRRAEPVGRVASRHGVSRKFAYEQEARAKTAIEEEFSPCDDDDVLCYIAVTKEWIRAAVLALALLCRGSFRGIGEFLRTMVGQDVSVGTVHNILSHAAGKAREVNASIGLSGVRNGAHDEIYQGDSPVLVGLDAKSIYCYLLSEEAGCDETTWGVRLLELEECGFHPDRVIADGGGAQRAGLATAMPKVPCDSDVFHAERALGTVAYYLKNRARGAVTARSKLERKMERAKRKGRGNEVSKKLAVARAEETKAVALARDVRVLADWLRDDVLAVAGPPLPERRELFDFIVAELASLEPLCPHRIGPVRRSLELGRDQLLGFAAVLDEGLADVARALGVMPHLVRQMCELQGISRSAPLRYERERALRAQLHGRFHDVERAVTEVMKDVVRASSLVENLNSRLRTYFFLRRQLGPDYLELLRFFLNHHPFVRSERPERKGKTPRELLTGTAHPHWLELLGYMLPGLN